MLRHFALAGLLVPLACTSTTPEPRADSPAPSPTSTPKPAPPAPEPAPPAPAQPEPGSAYFALWTKGIVELTPDGRLLVLNDTMMAPDDLLAAPDGQIYALGLLGLHRVSADRFEALTNPGDYVDGPEGASFAPDGSFWAVGRRGVGRYAKDDWARTPTSAFGEDIMNFQDIGFDRDGRPWVSAHTRQFNNRLFYSDDGEQWRLADEYPLTTTMFDRKLHRTPAGELYLRERNALVRIDGPGAFVEIPINDEHIIYASAVSPTGHFAFALECELLRLDPSDPVRSQRRFPAELLGDCQRIDALGIDADARIWALSDAGLHVLGPDEGQVAAYPRGSLPELADRATDMLVVGRGPASLPAPQPIQRGTLTAKLVRFGKPLPGVRVELCRRRHVFADRSPCSDDPVRFTARTDDAGRFRIRQVPLGSYEMAIKVGGRWRDSASFPADCMRADATCDIGAVDVDGAH